MPQRFLSWLAITLVCYLGIGAGLHFYYSLNPTRILVAVDSSFGMKARWPKVRQTLSDLSENKRYVEYALVTDKARVHSWKTKLSLGTTLSYGPRNLDSVLNGAKYAEVDDADQRILITNSAEIDPAFSAWTVIGI